jgi:Predicted carbamoyl transferase, NodU family
MTWSLGIHVGHDSSCALAKDGRVVAAIQQERLTRRKHDGHEALTNSLPVQACLEAAGITLDKVDAITTSFQAASPGGFGLHQPLISPDFNLFDPFDRRHLVMSHHLAHAWCAFGSSPLAEAAVLVCDLAGTSSLDGRDFHLPFARWYADMGGQRRAAPVRTEILSIYTADRASLTLLDREYTIPHNSGASFVHSVASLYENVTGFVFDETDAYGQLMALAAYGSEEGVPPPEALADVDEAAGTIVFRNDWQKHLPWRQDFQVHADLARATQTVTERALMLYARRAKLLTGRDALAVAGGIFLNIPANSRIAESGDFCHYHVPSAPHDAGISIGCAFQGHARLKGKVPVPATPPSDRLGPSYSSAEVEAALSERHRSVEIVCREAPPSLVAELIAGGAIVARWAGRAEFGPRALGGRSFLASPLIAATKDRLNRIKGRQVWRPVAPVIASSAFGEFFVGYPLSPYMSFAHRLRGEHAKALPALAHPDGTTRAQTLAGDDDVWLHDLLMTFRSLTGYPILVNTSLNGAGEAMVERAEDALALLLRHSDVDYLLLDEFLCRRIPAACRPCPRNLGFRLAAGAYLVRVLGRDSSRTHIIGKGLEEPVSDFIYHYLSGSTSLWSPFTGAGELWRLADLGLVDEADESP